MGAVSSNPAVNESKTGVSGEPEKVVIIGGGPGGYEAALVAKQLGADVTIVERNGWGGAAVLTDVVPSKALVSRGESVLALRRGAVGQMADPGVGGSFDDMNQEIVALAQAQSDGIGERLQRDDVTVLQGAARLNGPREVVATVHGEDRVLPADVVLLAVGASPRELDSAQPDGERILTWKQLYQLKDVPKHLVVVGSGVTGVEFAAAYAALGVEVTLVSSRATVLPNENQEAAETLQDVFDRTDNVDLRNKVRAVSAVNTGDGVRVELSDGSIVEGSHCLMAVGAVPNTADLGLETTKVRLTDSGHIVTNRVSRTTQPGVYAAGDCTGVFPLASVAAMQGRIAMRHALGDAVQPFDLRVVCANVFTSPEIATVGISQAEANEMNGLPPEADPDTKTDDPAATVATRKLLIESNPRARMQDAKDGFIRLFVRRGPGTVLGAVVVAPRASELIYPLTLAVQHRLTVDQLSGAFTVYPSLSGSIAEVARQLH